jgi:Undecaprenyl-phosphate glucose phosphotransferase
MKPLESGKESEVLGALSRMTDMALIALGALCVSRVLLRHGMPASIDTVLVAFAVAFTLIVFPLFGIYRSWRGRSMLRLSVRVALAWIAVLACAFVMSSMLHASRTVSPLWEACWAAATGCMLVVLRLAVHLLLGRMRRAGHDLRRVGIVGAGAHCDHVIRKIGLSAASGFRAASRFDTSGGIGLKDRVGESGLPTFHTLAGFAAHVRAERVTEIWIALPISEETVISSVIDTFRNDLVNLRFMPDVSSLATFDGHVVELIGTSAINLMGPPLSPRALAQKAVFDRLFALIALFGLAPLLMLIALAVKLSSSGPVLFTQRRKGAHGEVFRIFKFRTMRVHAEQSGVVQQATRGDPRITRLGAFLRRTSLDELPQFFNVLRGEMSVVGPRPHAIEHDDLYQHRVGGYIHRYRVKPGITGWAQVNGFRGETDRVEKMQGRVEYDLYYLRNWSFALDMRIVMATVFRGFVHRNAY